MARRRHTTFPGLIFLVLGILIGFVAAMGLGRTPSPHAQPLRYDAPPMRDPDIPTRDVLEDPGGYTESEAIFRGYLGTYSNRIAIFQGEPPHGTLQHITEYEVRDDLREQLEAGVPFRDAGELITLLENYTS